jgi:hypothetical protein
MVRGPEDSLKSLYFLAPSFGKVPEDSIDCAVCGGFPYNGYARKWLPERVFLAIRYQTTNPSTFIEGLVFNTSI